MQLKYAGIASGVPAKLDGFTKLCTSDVSSSRDNVAIASNWLSISRESDNLFAFTTGGSVTSLDCAWTVPREYVMCCNATNWIMLSIIPAMGPVNNGFKKARNACVRCSGGTRASEANANWLA